MSQIQYDLSDRFHRFRGERSLPFWLAGASPTAFFCLPTAGRGGDGKIQQPTPHSRGELWSDLAGVLDSAQTECHVTHPQPLPVAQLLHSSADPGWITSNVFFHYLCQYVSKTIKKCSYCLYICQIKNKKNSDQLILDRGPGVLSHIWPIRLIHLASGAGHE
jgi:hypothetical protein